MSRRLLPILVSLLGAGLIGLLVYGISTPAASRTLDEAVAQGRYPAAPASTHSLAALSGNSTASLASFRGKVVVLNFWASWCEPCQVEAPLLEQTQRQLQRQDGTVLGVADLNASPSAKAFVRQYHLTYPNLQDMSGDFAHSYGTDQLPETFVIDRHGQIVAIHRGEDTSQFLKHAISLAESL